MRRASGAWLYGQIDTGHLLPAIEVLTSLGGIDVPAARQTVLIQRSEG